MLFRLTSVACKWKTCGLTDEEEHTNSSDRWLLGTDRHTHTQTHTPSWLSSMSPKTADGSTFRFCIQGLRCHFSNNTQHLLSVGASAERERERERLAPQSLHRPAAASKKWCGKKKKNPCFSLSTFHKRNRAGQRNQQQSDVSSSAVVTAAKGVTRRAVAICHWRFTLG